MEILKSIGEALQRVREGPVSIDRGLAELPNPNGETDLVSYTFDQRAADQLGLRLPHRDAAEELKILRDFPDDLKEKLNFWERPVEPDFTQEV